MSITLVEKSVVSASIHLRSFWPPGRRRGWIERKFLKLGEENVKGKEGKEDGVGTVRRSREAGDQGEKMRLQRGGRTRTLLNRLTTLADLVCCLVE